MAKNPVFQGAKRVNKFVAGLLFVGMFLSIDVSGAAATTSVKILSDSRHAYSTINSTIDLLMGTGHIGTDFIVHSTNMNTGGGFYTSAGNALNTTTQRYDHTGALVPSAGPYQIYTTSATGYPGDSVYTYNLYASNDLAYNYAFSNIPATAATQRPPAFYIAPGGSGYASSYGVEWTLNPAIFCTANLSCQTAANAGIVAVLRFLHPTWNWYDAKAALRQTGTNWVTGYNRTTYGFGQVNYATATALLDNQILLQPPAALGSIVSGRISFNLYPFKQTRRVKEVLFQFPSAPAFQANELSLSAIQALGGTKIMEYTDTIATTTRPFYAAITNGYFAWLSADNANDAVANFSRIDTYSVQGPLSQSEVSFEGSFYSLSPATNIVATNTSPTFSWNPPTSYLGIAKYQLFIDGVLDTDNITGTSTIPTTPLSDGTHTWYVKVFNGGGASLSTSVRTINVNTSYSSGYTFYVDNVLGDDNDPGTQAQPWATLTKASATAVAGDTVVIIKNTGVPYRETLTPTNPGTASSTITFRGVDASNKPEIWGSADISSGWSLSSGGNPDTYQYATTTNIQVLAAGQDISSLTKKTQGTATSTLNTGEWFWASNVLYYRLAAGEVMGSLHIEVSIRSRAIEGGTYHLYKDIIARYVNNYAVNVDGTNTTVYGLEEYDSYGGIMLGSWGSNNIIKYSLAARNKNHGFFADSAFSGNIYNSLSYGNTAKGGYFLAWFVPLVSTIKNNIFSGNGSPSIHVDPQFGNAVTLTASHNLWDNAPDSNWDSRKGTNNQELVNPLLVSPASHNFQLQPFSPAIDAGTSGSGVTTDILGNPIYGTPDMGPYEYQPPYTVGVDNIDSTAPVRIYKNGKYRYVTAPTGGTSAILHVTPVGGFPSADYSEFLDITISRWNTGGDYAKTWTETSTSATTTLHTVGNMNPGELYNVVVDGVTPPYVQARADTSGTITFTYSGGYSTHTFDISKYDAGGTSYIYGCTDPVATNYDATATSDDNRCLYAPASESTPVTADAGYVASTETTSMMVSGSTTDSIATSTTSEAGSIALALLDSLSALNATSTSSVATSTTATTSTSTSTNIFSSMRLFSRAIVRTLSFGMRGDDVWRLQDRLRQDPVIYPEGYTTGYFGRLTERAVQRFQVKHDIVATGTPATTGYGVFGPRTRGVLFTALSMINTAPPLASSTPSVGTTTPRVTVYRTLMLGTTGRDVAELQTALAEDPTLYPEGLVSGYFGSATERAVKRFQVKHDIVATGTPQATGYGVFGGETRRVMMSMVH